MIRGARDSFGAGDDGVHNAMNHKDSMCTTRPGTVELVIRCTARRPAVGAPSTIDPQARNASDLQVRRLSPVSTVPMTKTELPIRCSGVNFSWGLDLGRTAPLSSSAGPRDRMQSPRPRRPGAAADPGGTPS